MASTLQTHDLGAVPPIIGECQRASGGAARGGGERHTDGTLRPGRDAGSAGVAGNREAWACGDAGKAKRYAFVVRQRNGLGRARAANVHGAEIQGTDGKRDLRRTAPRQFYDLRSGIIGNRESSGHRTRESG